VVCGLVWGVGVGVGGGGLYIRRNELVLGDSIVSNRAGRLVFVCLCVCVGGEGLHTHQHVWVLEGSIVSNRASGLVSVCMFMQGVVVCLYVCVCVFVGRGYICICTVGA